MKRVMLVIVVGLLLTAAAPAAQCADELAGLWKAERHFGPAARGTLILARAQDAWTADFMGERLPVTATGTRLAFDLAGRGRFEGRLAPAGVIEGHWFAPGTATSGGGFRFAVPGRLEPVDIDRWQGEIRPLDDTFTLYLRIEERADGTLGAFLRNPERNMGVFMNVERIERKGDALTLLGKRMGQKDESALLRGVVHAGRDTFTVFWPERGGSFDFYREGDASLFYPRGREPARYAWSQPLARDDGWPTGTLEDAGMDRAAIERFVQAMLEVPMDSVEAPELHGILVARRGTLVLEEYFHGAQRDRLHDTRSAAKSLTATLIGAGLHARVPLELASPVYQVMHGGSFPAGLEPRKRAMTLEHLLTMSSGYWCDDGDPEAPGNEDAMLDQDEEGDYYRYTLRVPMAFDPGEHSIYCSVNPNLALGMLGRAANESPLALFDRLLGRPMKIERYAWILDPAGNPYGGGSVSMLPRDFMKLGQLMLDGGVWDGERLLGQDFVERASAPLYHNRNISYGYLWWGIDYPYKNRTVHGYFAGGNGGQGVIVIPELELVIATYGGSYASRQTIHITHELPVRYILPSVREAGDNRAAPVVFNQWVSPYGRSDANGPVRAEERARR